MIQIWFYSILSVVLVSLVSLIGALTLYFREEKLKKALIFFVSFSAGALLGGAFLHLLPEVIEEFGYSFKVSFWLIGGLFIFFVIEKYIHWRHCHEPTSAAHPHHLGTMNLVGDGFHNFLDGLIIAASYLTSPALGLTATLAIVLHEIPQEIADFGVLLHAGYSKSKAVVYNLISALIAIMGVVIGLILGGKIGGFTSIILPIAAGGFIYIAAADLMPELHKETKMAKSIWQLATFIVGVCLMYFLTFLE